MASVQELLESLGYGSFLQNFKDNDIDDEALALLSDEEIKILIPSIGPQVKFKKALNTWKESQVNKENQGPSQKTNTELSSPSSSFCDKNSECSDLSIPENINKIKDLKSLLGSTQEGQKLLQQTEPLGEQLRKLLAREIAREIVQFDPKASVTADIYYHWTKEIKRIFPKENIALYFTKPPAGCNGRAHGRLFDAVTNLKAKYRRNKIYEPRSRRSLDFDRTLTPTSSEIDQDKGNVTQITSELLNDDSVEECFEWLRSSTDNYSLCEENWAKTRSSRQRSIRLIETVDYLQDFPCLSRSWGYVLLTADFDKWYPDNQSRFELQFPTLKIKLLSLLERTSHKSDFLDQLRNLAKSPDTETSNLAALLAIVHFVAPVQWKRKKFSSAEVRDSFIVNINEEKHLNEERKKRQDTCKGLGITLQPYIIVAGPLDKITTRYISVNNIIYEATSITSAVDTCFKIFWALNLKYPCQSNSVWQFLERAVYKFPEAAINKCEKIAPSVLGLLTDCAKE